MPEFANFISQFEESDIQAFGLRVNGKVVSKFGEFDKPKDLSVKLSRKNWYQ